MNLLQTKSRMLAFEGVGRREWRNRVMKGGVGRLRGKRGEGERPKKIHV